MAARDRSMVPVVSPPPPVILPRHPATLRDLAPRFLSWFAVVRDRRENTVKSYAEDLRTFVAFAEEHGITTPAQVDHRVIETYLAWLVRKREPPLKTTTANRHRYALKQLWVYLCREGLAAGNPIDLTFVLRQSKRLPKYIAVLEQERLLAALAQDQTLIGRRDYSLIATGLFTGLRVEEMANLRLEHVDLKVGTLRVVEGKGGKDRELPIVPRLETILRTYLDEVRRQLIERPRGFVARKHRRWRVEVTIGHRKQLPEPFATEREARAWVHEHFPPPPDAGFVFINANPRGGYRMHRAGLPLLTRSIFLIVRQRVSPIIDRPAFPHLLRHSFASRLRESGAPLELIQEAMGHADIRTTTIYAHISTTKRREELTRFLEGPPSDMEGTPGARGKGTGT